MSLRFWLRFLGPRLLPNLAAAGLLGIALSGVEIIYSYSVQAFILVLGLTDPSKVSLPDWIPRDSAQAVLVLLIVVTGVRSLAQWAQSFAQGACLEQFKYNQRSRLLSWLYTAPSMSSPELVRLFGETCNRAGDSLSSLQTVITYGVAALLMAVGLFQISVPVTAVSLLGLAILAIPIRVFQGRIQRAGEGLARAWEQTNRRLLLSIRTLFQLRIYGMASSEERETESSLKAYLHSAEKAYFDIGLLTSAIQVLGVALVCVIALAMRARSELPAGAFVSFFYLFFRFLQTLTAFVNGFSNFLFSRADLRRLVSWWREREVPAAQGCLDDRESGGRFSAPVGWSLKRVSFRYEGAQRPLFSQFDLEVPPGSSVVFRGGSGAGKSTLLGLLLGELDFQGGEIRIETGLESLGLKETRSRLRKSVGYVGPESFMVEGTIRENLCYGLDREPTESEMFSALERADASFVRALPLGLEHRLTEQGQGLSAGQKQRLALARALLRDPKVLILDEATANLDAETEERLMRTLENLKGRMTMVAVSHKAEAFRFVDREVVL